MGTYLSRTGVVFCLLASCSLAPAQQNQAPSVAGAASGEWINSRGNPYGAKSVSPVSLQNSPRLASILRGGLIYLSLPDAIALALENNLDVELQRFAPAIADTDILRTRGGGTTRGVTFSSAQPPAGVGGPASPLLNAATPGFTTSSTVASSFNSLAFLTSGQTNLSIAQGAFSAGTPVPVYDPALTGQLTWNHQSTPQTNPFITGANVLINKITNGGFGFTKGFSPGTQIGANFTSASQSNNSIRSTLNPFNNSSFGLTLTQPLLRGFGSRVNRRFIRIASNDRRISDLVFRQQLIDTVYGVTRLYYDLVSLNEDVRVKQQTLALAQKLYEDDRAQVEQGTLAPIELVRAQALIAASRQDLANSDGLLREQELVMKSALTRGNIADPMIRDTRIVPIDPIPAPAQEPVQPVQDLLATAFQNRPDVAAAGLQIENAQMSVEGSRSLLRPDVSLVANASNAGLAGQINPLATAIPGTGSTGPSPAFIGGVGTALEQIFRRNYPTYGIGVQLNLPLRNRVAQADYVRDLLQYRQMQVQQQRVANQARLEVEDALIALQRSRTAYDAAVQTRQYQEQSLAAEQERFAVGLSTTFLIIQYQNMLAQARTTEVVARGAYAKARANLDRALGMTLENSNISFAEGMSGQVSRPPTPIPVNPPAPPSTEKDLAPQPVPPLPATPPSQPVPPQPQVSPQTR